MMINQFFHTAAEAAKATFMKFGKLEVALLFILERNGRISHFAVPLDGNKDHVSYFLKITAQLSKPVAMSFISEAWVVMRTVDKNDKSNVDDLMKGRVAVSEQPDKTECLMIMQETSLSSSSRMIPIIKKGNVISFGEEQSHTETKGRFTHFLYHEQN